VSLVTIRVTHVEAQQLLNYVSDRDMREGAGWYYGDKAQFERRHESIKAVLARAIERHADTSTAAP
jgi:hypothetical protein